MAQCTAKSKRSGRQCKKDAVQGSTKCHMHGGKSLAATASPRFKHGRYSSYLPERLAERYHAAQADRELLALRDEIALLDARISDVLAAVGTGTSADMWQELQRTYDEMKRANSTGDKVRSAAALATLLRLIQQGSSEQQAWAEVYDLLERRRRLVESERKRLVEMQQMITSEQAMAMMGAITATIKEHVHDRQALAAIAADLRALTIISPSG